MRIVLAGVLAAVLLISVGCTALGGNERKVPGAEIFTKYGWEIAGPVTESGDRLPATFTLESARFPWRIFVDLSSDIGLDLSASAGKNVRVLRFPVTDKQGTRLREVAATYDLQGVALLDGDTVVGAWLTYSSKDGTPLRGTGGFSLNGKDLEQVTGMTWPQYSAKHAGATAAPPAATATLDATTAVLFGGGQTAAITVTDQSTIRSMRAELAAAQPLSKPEAAATLFSAWFKAGDQQVAQLWMLRAHASNDVLAVRFEGESDWRAVSPALNGLLKQILDQVPGPKMP